MNIIAFNHVQITVNDYATIDLEHLIRVYNIPNNIMIYETDPMGNAVFVSIISGNVIEITKGLAPMLTTDPMHILYDDTSYDIPENVSDGRRLVTTAGTRVQLSATSVPCKSVAITAMPANTGIMVVGGSTVVGTTASRQGVPLSPGDTISLDIDNLNKIYVDATQSGEGVTYAYTK